VWLHNPIVSFQIKVQSSHTHKYGTPNSNRKIMISVALNETLFKDNSILIPGEDNRYMNRSLLQSDVISPATCLDHLLFYLKHLEAFLS
jgi:hypothetical protein